VFIYYNYGITPTKVCVEFESVSSYFVVCGFSITIRATNASLLFMRFGSR
jgi:hypothetical protein